MKALFLALALAANPVVEPVKVPPTPKEQLVKLLDTAKERLGPEWTCDVLISQKKALSILQCSFGTEKFASLMVFSEGEWAMVDNTFALP